MKQTFFDLNDNFEKVINNVLDGVISVEKIPTGWTNYVFKVNTGNETYVFRFPRNNFFAERMKRELIYARFVRSKISVATPEYVELRHEGRIFSKHKMIPGHVLTDVFCKMNQEQRTQLAHDVVKYILEIQSISENPLPVETSTEFLVGLSAVNGNKYDMTKLERLRELDRDMKQSHGDLNPGNIIVDDNYKMIAVLDYAFVPRSSRLIDLARIVERLSGEFFELFISEFEKQSATIVDRADLDYLIDLWKYVQIDYVDYMGRCHPDVVLPSKPF